MLRSINARHLLLDKFLTTAVSLGLDELVGLEDSPPSSQSSLPDSPQVPERLHLPGLSSLPPSSPASPSLSTEQDEPPSKVLRTRKRAAVIRTSGSASLIPTSSHLGTSASTNHGDSGMSSQPPAKLPRTSTKVSKTPPSSSVPSSTSLLHLVSPSSYMHDFYIHR